MIHGETCACVCTYTRPSCWPRMRTAPSAYTRPRVRPRMNAHAAARAGVYLLLDTRQRVWPRVRRLTRLHVLARIFEKTRGSTCSRVYVTHATARVGAYLAEGTRQHARPREGHGNCAMRGRSRRRVSSVRYAAASHSAYTLDFVHARSRSAAYLTQFTR